MNAYRVEDLLLRGTSQVIGASETDTVVSDVFSISPEDSRNLLIKVVAASTTVATGVTATLQESYDGGTTWETSGKTVSITSNAAFEIEQDASEASTGCLWPLGRVTITSGSGDAATITAVWVTRRI